METIQSAISAILMQFLINKTPYVNVKILYNITISNTVHVEIQLLKIAKYRRKPKINA